MKQVLIAIDQMLNTLIWIRCDGWGYADETLSARLFRCYMQGCISDVWYRLVDALFFFEADHCYESWISEFQRRHLPDDYGAIA